MMFICRKKNKNSWYSLLLHLLVMIITFSCIKSEYRELKDGVYFKLIGFTEQAKDIDVGDYVTADLKFFTMKDSAFFRGKKRFRIDDPEKQGSFNYAFLEMHQGDSASVIVPVKDFFMNTMKTNIPAFLNNEEVFKIRLRIAEVQTRKEFEKEKELFIEWLTLLQETEAEKIRKYVSDEKIPFNKSNEGIYYFSLKEGTGRKPLPGDHITLHYEGKFLNGKYIESTIKRGQPLDFKLGSEMVVIEGIEIALKKMSEGEKALVIIPSDLAFGRDGAADGLIPPYASMIYELELLKIN